MPTYIEELDAELSETRKTELLFSWLCDDHHRPALYAQLRQRRPVLRFASCAPSASGQQTWTYLITDTATIAKALKEFSNSVYRGIGTGTFVLGTDIGPHHDAQRKSLIQALMIDPKELHGLAALASYQALIAPTKTRNFDLVTDVAQQAAVRFIGAYFGFPDSDLPLLQDALRRGFDGMILQMFARHFVTELTIPVTGKSAMGALTDRIAALLREAGPTPQRARIFEIIGPVSDAARDSLKAFASDLGDVDGNVGGPVRKAVDTYLAAFATPGLAARTADLFDLILNFRTVRARVPTSLQKLAPEVRQGLTTIIHKSIEAKTAPDPYSIPRRRVIAGTPADGDYVFRQTVIDKLARDPGNKTSLELAVDVIGLIAGLIGNVVAGTSASLDAYFKSEDPDSIKARAAAFDPSNPTTLLAAIQSATTLEPFVWEAMRLQPPATFLPRTTLADGQLQYDGVDLPKGTEVIVPLGAPTRDGLADPDKFNEANLQSAATRYIFGDLNEGLDSHRCIGNRIALPLITHIVRSVLTLRSLARQTVGGEAATLKKKWGYVCESFPLCYDRDTAIVQRPLNVVMDIKHPAAEHAAKLKMVIKYGAPVIEHLLSSSKIVHFARFIFLNDEKQLALLTTYDGEFGPYIRHFAEVAGPLFDKIFEHIEDQPPMPVRQNIDAFIAHIEKHDIPSVGNYFFSAHPSRTVK